MRVVAPPLVRSKTQRLTALLASISKARGKLSCFVAYLTLSVTGCGPAEERAERTPRPQPESADVSGNDPKSKSWTDDLKNEPQRPKATTPVQFSHSYSDAIAEARRTGRRVLAVFTGEACLWCRVLENRTFTDAEVAELSKNYVRVEIRNDDKHAPVWDEFHVDAIPQSFILTPDGLQVDRLDGYVAATQYASWLKEGLSKGPQTDSDTGDLPRPPKPAGADENHADVVFWFVDAEEQMKAWAEPKSISHDQLLALLERAGLRGRIEHLSQWDFPARWELARKSGRGPDIIASARLTGTLRELDRSSRLRAIVSNRLFSHIEWAGCKDFARRFVWASRDSARPSDTLRAADVLLKCLPGSLLDSCRLEQPPRSQEATRVAAQAVEGYLVYDPQKLSAVAASGSFLNISHAPFRKADWRAGMRVTVSDVIVRGNERFSLGIAEARRENEILVADDPVLVVLVSENGRWRVLTVSSDDSLFDTVARLSNLQFRDGLPDSKPSQPLLLAPADGAEIGQKGLSWELSKSGTPPIAQVAEVIISGSGSDGWPDAVRLSVSSGDQPRGSFDPGISGETMAWRVWSIAPSGQVSTSTFRSYRWPTSP